MGKRFPAERAGEETEEEKMDKKMYNTWMAITTLVLGVIGLIFILVSVFDSGAGTTALIIGLLFVAAGTVLNIIRLRQTKTAETGRNDEHV